MAKWFKAFFQSSTYSGSFIKLSEFTNNYNTRLIFLSSSLQIKNNQLFLTNLEYDPFQDQEKYQSFDIKSCKSFTKYSIEVEKSTIFCIKWAFFINNKKTVYGFEFRESVDFSEISSQLGIKLEEEGHQAPNESKSIKNLYLENIPPSKIFQKNTLPSPTSEEKTLKSQYEFKKSVILSLSHLYSPMQILFISAGDLYLDNHLTDEGIGFLIIKHEDFIVSLDIVRDNEVVMRIIINKHFYYKVIKEKKVIE